MGNIVSISTIGQDSHRFGEPSGDTFIRLGGIDIPFDKPIEANSDGDVVYHAITNAVSGFTGVNILGGAADKICLEQGIKDSRVYLEKALEYLNGGKIIHCSVTIECLRPKLMPHIPAMKESIGRILGIDSSSVGITATTGEGLTGFGRGEGIQVFCILTFTKEI
ncbi:MAG: 2-C-methyl-D-erythritol 2,4-cyclodiphosphate synthase [Clostridiales bacterium]|nr:2-C-methyl-D-erythritol 2,4-cyclodiphosphate synthase [Clostridiales bacterium]